MHDRRFERSMLGRCHWLAVLLAAATIGTVPATLALAEDTAATNSSGACFDIVRPLTAAAAGAILLNRCTGQTWILVRSRTKNSKAFAYRWRPIAHSTTEFAADAPRVPGAPRLRRPAGGNSDRCFTFQERQFCE